MGESNESIDPSNTHIREQQERPQTRRRWQTPQVTASDVASTENATQPPNDGTSAYTS